MLNIHCFLDGPAQNTKCRPLLIRLDNVIGGMAFYSGVLTYIRASYFVHYTHGILVCGSSTCVNNIITDRARLYHFPCARQCSRDAYRPRTATDTDRKKGVGKWRIVTRSEKKIKKLEFKTYKEGKTSRLECSENNKIASTSSGLAAGAVGAGVERNGKRPPFPIAEMVARDIDGKDRARGTVSSKCCGRGSCEKEKTLQSERAAPVVNRHCRRPERCLDHLGNDFFATSPFISPWQRIAQFGNQKKRMFQVVKAQQQQQQQPTISRISPMSDWNSLFLFSLRAAAGECF